MTRTEAAEQFLISKWAAESDVTDKLAAPATGFDIAAYSATKPEGARPRYLLFQQIPGTPDITEHAGLTNYASVFKYQIKSVAEESAGDASDLYEAAHDAIQGKSGTVGGYLINVVRAEETNFPPSDEGDVTYRSIGGTYDVWVRSVMS